MMIIPISTEEFAAKIFRSERVAQKAMAARIYKGTALQVRQEKSLRGKPSYLVLWDTELNQPATGDNYENKAGILEVLPEKSEVLESRIAERIAVRESLSISNRAYPVVDCTLQKTDRKPADRAISELNQPAIGENHATETAPTARPNRTDSCEGKQQSQDGRGLPAVLMARPPENQDFGTPAKNSTHLTDLSSVLTAENSSSTAETVDSVGSHFFKPASFKKLAKNAEKNAQERDNKRMDAVLDKVFGDSNEFNQDVVDISKVRPAAFQTQSSHNLQSNSGIQETKATYELSDIYKSESRLAEQNPILPPQTQTAVVVLENLAIDQTNGWILNKEEGELLPYPRGYNCQIDYVIELIKQKVEPRLEKAALNGAEKLKKAKKAAASFKSELLAEYYASLTIPDTLIAEWEAVRLLPEPAKTNFIQKYQRTAEVAPVAIPARLRVKNAKTLTGRSSTVKPEISKYFVAYIKEICTPDTLYTADKLHRNYPAFQRELSHQFGETPTVKQLRTIVQNENLLYLLKSKPSLSEKDRDKPLKHCSHAPVGRRWQMDGSWSKTIEIKTPDGKWKSFEVIGILDEGSNYKLGHKAYFSESGANTMDFLKHSLMTNKIPAGTSEQTFDIVISPDNGSGFLLSEGIQQYSAKKWRHTHRVIFVVAPFKARQNSGKKTEPSWNAMHTDLEERVIRHFRGKIAGAYYKKQSKNGRNIEVYVRQIAITLDELNDSGVIQRYVHESNAAERPLTVEGVLKKVCPSQQWEEMLEQQGYTNFAESDFKDFELIGIAKDKATVTNDGLIQFDNAKYKVTDRTLFTAKRTDIRVGKLDDGRLAVYNSAEEKNEDGTEVLCYAIPSVAPDAEKAAFIEDKVLAKFESSKKASAKQLNEDGIFKLFEIINLSVKTIESRLEKARKLIDMGLTTEIAQTIISNDLDIQSNQREEELRWSLFYSDATEILRKSNLKLVRNAS